MKPYPFNPETEQIVHKHQHYIQIKSIKERALHPKMRTIYNTRSYDSTFKCLYRIRFALNLTTHRFDYYVEMFLRPTKRTYFQRAKIVKILLDYYSIRELEERLHISHQTIQKMLQNTICLTKPQRHIFNLINQSKVTLTVNDLMQKTGLSKRQIQRHIRTLDINGLVVKYKHNEIGRVPHLMIKVE